MIPATVEGADAQVLDPDGTLRAAITGVARHGVGVDGSLTE